MTQPLPVTGYASIADYELRTGMDVPDAQEPTVQQRLNDTSSLINVYLGECTEEVAAKYPDVLTALTVSHVYRVASVPTGVRSESIGGTSVSYDTDAGPLDLVGSETTLLDALMDGACGESSKGVGQIGVNYGGPAPEASDLFPTWPDVDEVDFWILSGGRRR